MAIRVRSDGTMVCAAHSKPEDGDTYIDDGLHYEMSVVKGAVMTTRTCDHGFFLYELCEACKDETAVNAFSFAMKEKLAKKRKEGRGGWSGDKCNAGILSGLLREHVEKGDPLDVGNLAMMLHQRGESIMPLDAQAEIARLTKERDSAVSMESIGKSFHDLAVKERDLAQYQLTNAKAEIARLTAENARLREDLASAREGRDYID